MPSTPTPSPQLALSHRPQAKAQSRSLAIALSLAIPLAFQFTLPAQAGFLDTLRGVFTGDTGEGAQGNARGASIRDRRCGAATPIVNAGEEAASSTTSPTSSAEQLILLVPNTGETLTATTIPEVFVYIPPYTSSAAEPAPPMSPEPLSPAPETNLDLTKIDLDDIDSVVDEGVQDEVDQAHQSELLLEFQFNGTSQYYELPSEALIAKLQVPETATFEIGKTSPLEVRLVCRRYDLTSFSQTAATESSYSTESEVFAAVQRVEPSRKLTAAIATHAPDDVYQAYLENGLWFEMVAALAANPQSEEWAALLQELDVPAVDPVPQTLVPVAD